MDEERELYKEAVLGEDAQNFWNTELGQWVVGKSLKESESATEKLREIDPEDSKTIRELQNEIQISERCLVWLNEAIVSGKQALDLLESRE